MNDFLLIFLVITWFWLLFEPIIINFIYLRNIGLFLDLFVSKKNQDHLRDYFKK